MKRSPTEAVVDALHSLITFTPDQAAAYREFFAEISIALGPDVETQLQRSVVDRATSGEPGVIILTGNAGTGKTSVMAALCRAVDISLPTTDDLVQTGRFLLAKDVSAIEGRENRATAVKRCLASMTDNFALLCINEGILRDVSEDLADEEPELTRAVTESIQDGFYDREGLTVIDLNRQRFTPSVIWNELMDFLTRRELWIECGDCPLAVADGDTQCPLRANAKALRNPQVRETLRDLVRIAGGDVVPTVRELLSLMAYAIVGEVSHQVPEPHLLTCEEVRERTQQQGLDAFTCDSAFYNLALGSGLAPEMTEKSPLLSAISSLGVGKTANLRVDEWLRDAGDAPPSIRLLAGLDNENYAQTALSNGDPLSRVRTSLGSLTFAGLGEKVTLSEYGDTVEACVDALVSGSNPAQASWRRNVFFRADESSGLSTGERSQLLELSFAFEFLSLVDDINRDLPCYDELSLIVSGLNYLATGFSATTEGLIVPEPSSLFARDPGSFRRADPAFVHTQVPLHKLHLSPYASKALKSLVDSDAAKIKLYVDVATGIELDIGPYLFQAIVEAQRFKGPVSQRWGEMTQLRAFYGAIATSESLSEINSHVSIADPRRGVVVKASLPRWTLA